MLTQGERTALLGAVNELAVELGFAESDAVPGAESLVGGELGVVAEGLDPNDEQLVAEIRRSLAKIAAGLDGGDAPLGAEIALAAALDGTEMVMRGEVALRGAGRLPQLIPGFVFLVSLSLVDQRRALELSDRTAELLERALK